MRITRVSTTVRDTAAVVGFLHRTLEVDVEQHRSRAIVHIGATCLELEDEPAANGELHLAITIPIASFASAKRALERRTRLLTIDGADEFEASPSWNARSMYFEAPDGTVLELIARRDLESDRSGVGAADVLGISEVGVTVADVPAAVVALREQSGIVLYGQDEAGDTFAPVGSAAGMLILVTEGRAWFPTSDRRSSYRPIRIEATGGRPGDYHLAQGTRLVLR